MIKIIFYSVLVYFTVWCKATDIEFYPSCNGTNETSETSCVELNERNESHYTQLGTNKTSKPCILTFNDFDISELLELGQRNLINVVDIHFKFQSRTSSVLIQNVRWIWANTVGLEILSLLEMLVKMGETSVTLTLNAQRTTASLAVSEDPPECILSQENKNDFISGTLLERLSISGRFKKKLCYKMQNNSQYSRCCKILSLSTGKKRPQCYPNSIGSQFVKILEPLHSTFLYVALVVGGNIIFLISLSIPWKNSYRNRWYYELKESPMSLSSIFSWLFWNEYDFSISLIRRLLLFAVVGCSHYFGRKLLLSRVSDAAVYAMFFSWALSLFVQLGYPLNAQDISSSAIHKSQQAFYYLTLPYNYKYWEDILQSFYDGTINVLQCLRCSHKVVQNIVYYLLCLVFIPIAFVLSAIGTIFIVAFWSVADAENFTNRAALLYHLLYLSSCLIFSNLLLLLLELSIPFFTGIIININFFFPYITLTSVLSFYLWNFWSSIEEKYFILKTLVYEEVENINNNKNDDGNNNDDNSNNDNNGNANIQYDDNEIVCVLSKELYHTLRERFLPYNEYLFHFVLKLFLLIVFSYITLTLVEILQASDISPSVQLISTFSVGAFPLLMNIVAAQKGEEEKYTWKKDLRTRVKPEVIKLTNDNSQFLEIHSVKPRTNESGHERNVPNEREV